MRTFDMQLIDNMCYGNMEGWEGGTGELCQAAVCWQYVHDPNHQMVFTQATDLLDCELSV